jgi:hypothetical protein
LTQGVSFESRDQVYVDDEDDENPAAIADNL